VNLAEVNEKLADMRASVAWLYEELKCLKDVTSSKTARDVVETTNTRITSPGIAVIMDKAEVQLEVCCSIHDAAKRKCNLVITGLPAAAKSSPQDDCVAFTQLCKEHLSVKPVLSHKGCRRLAKRIDQVHAGYLFTLLPKLELPVC